MRKETKRDRAYLAAFGVVSVLLFAQVTWWTLVFLEEVSRVEVLGKRLALTAAESAVVESEAYHRRVMFLSESAAFAVLTMLGFGILYRGYRRERQSLQTQRNFIELFSHESKTPLTALKLQLEALKKKYPTEDSLPVALDQVRRLTMIVDKALGLNRVEQHALEFEVLSLSEVAEEVARRLSPWAMSREVQVTLDLKGDGWVKGDRHSLENVVQSLLENAVLYSPVGTVRPKVRLTLQTVAHQVSLQVEDNGPGIPSAEVPRLFERFFRGSTGKATAGTGLGLYLAKHLVEAHRGVLQYLTPKGGVGSAFEILLPATGAPT